MRICHSLNALCGYMFASNAIDGVIDVSIHETSKGRVKKEKNVILVKMI